jgi:hypothetical protein
MDPVQTSILKQLNWLKLYAIGSTLVMAAILTLSFTDKTPDVIRTQGLVITDEEGRERILIGAPVPPSKQRVRTDLDKVMQEWAAKMGGERYMENYTQNLYHGVEGILFLNDEGYDKLLLGEKMPDPNTGKRLVDAAGFTFNDDRGFERGGLGISKTETGEYRIVFGMDDPKVGEALHLFVLEDGTKGLQIASEEGRLLLGSSPENGAFFNNQEKFFGIKAEDNWGKVLWEENVLIKTRPSK